MIAVRQVAAKSARHGQGASASIMQAAGLCSAPSASACRARASRGWRSVWPSFSADYWVSCPSWASGCCRSVSSCSRTICRSRAGCDGVWRSGGTDAGDPLTDGHPRTGLVEQWIAFRIRGLWNVKSETRHNDAGQEMKAFFVVVLSAVVLSGISAEAQAIDSRGFDARGICRRPKAAWSTKVKAAATTDLATIAILTAGTSVMGGTTASGTTAAIVLRTEVTISEREPAALPQAL